MKKILLIISITLLSFIGNSQLKALVLGAEYSILRIDDVKNKLDSTNRFSSVTALSMKDSTPTQATLLTYDVILLFCNNAPDNDTLLGNRLAICVDSGIGIVDAAFNFSSWRVKGNFTSYSMFTGGSNASSSVRTLGTILKPSHPIMYGVTSYNGGSSSFHASTITKNAGVYTVANYDNGTELVLAKDSVGTLNTRRAFLNLYPVSEDVSSGYRSTTDDGTKMIANALEWVGNRAIGVGVKEVVKTKKINVFPNPSTDKISFNINNDKIVSLKVIDVSGKIVMDKIPSKNSIDITGLEKGLYIIKIYTGKENYVSRFLKK